MGRNMFLANVKDNYSISVTTEDFLASQINRIIISSGGNINEFLFIDTGFEGTIQDLLKYKTVIRSLFKKTGCKIDFISDSGDLLQSVVRASAIAVGGGSLQKLITLLNPQIKNAIMIKTAGGVPYVGFNAGSEFASPVSINAAPDTINCLNALPFKFSSNFIDSPDNRDVLQEFLINHKESTVKVKYITALATAPDGSGIRMEDDDAGLALPNRVVEPLFLFELDQKNKIYAKTYTPDDLNIILSSPVI